MKLLKRGSKLKIRVNLSKHLINIGSFHGVFVEDTSLQLKNLRLVF